MVFGELVINPVRFFLLTGIDMNRFIELSGGKSDRKGNLKSSAIDFAELFLNKSIRNNLTKILSC